MREALLMMYRIARDGQVYGPYTLAEVRRYMESGNILATDLAQAEGAAEWLPVEEMFPTAAPAEARYPGGLPRLFPDPPDLPWWGALLLGIVTAGLFFVVWDLVEAAWMRRVERGSQALGWYVAVTVVYVVRLPATYHSLLHNLGLAPALDAPHGTLLGIVAMVLALVARFKLRRELLEHFNGPEPLGLALSGVMTFFFGGLYFQYHFNRINEVKRQLRVSVPAV